MRDLLLYVTARLTEASTWRGLIKLAALGTALEAHPTLWHTILADPASIETLVAAAVALNGLIQVALPDKSEWFRRAQPGVGPAASAGGWLRSRSPPHQRRPLRVWPSAPSAPSALGLALLRGFAQRQRRT